MVNNCFSCSGKNTEKVNTYKRNWIICNDCGCASSEQKNKYPLSFLKKPYLKKDLEADFANVYDSMVSEAHIQHSVEDFNNFKVRFSPFVDQYINGEEQKNILDISGGNGHFLHNFKGKNNNTVITEVNSKSLEYTKKKFGMPSVYYDVNKDNIVDLMHTHQLHMKFDLIMVRACSMFVKNMGNFINDLSKILNNDGVIIMNRNVQPTIGTFNRTQFDEFSYLRLYQPATVINELNNHNFEVMKSDLDADIYNFYSTYNDTDIMRYIVSSYYQHKHVMQLRKKALSGNEKFSFRRRDRQMFYIVAKKCK